MSCHIFICHMFALLIFCYIWTYSNEQNISSHLQSTQQSAMLISNPEMCNCRKSCMIECKHKSCLKIKQYCIKNNVLLSCKHYGIKRDTAHARRCSWICCQMVLCWMCKKSMPVNLAHCCWLLMSFFIMSLSYANRGLLCHHLLYVARHLICAPTFPEN